MAAICIAVAGAALCCWATLCLLFWQGSWQLLYHPASVVTRTPAAVGLAFEPVAFAADEAGQTRLSGWWIPAGPQARFGQYTVLHLHGQAGNVGNTVDDVAGLHAAGVNVLAFDYRGYGQSQFARPSEALWREDAESALRYLTGTRQIAAGAILLDGKGLGADLALEMAAAHPELAGVILQDPIPNAANAIFSDPRARLVPAHLLVRDRYDMNTPAAALRIPSLWLLRSAVPSDTGLTKYTDILSKVTARKTMVELKDSGGFAGDPSRALQEWLTELPGKSGNPQHDNR